MRRVISIYLPNWQTDRKQRGPGLNGEKPPARDKPFAIITAEGNQQILAAVNDAAAEAGLTPGMTLTHAQALVHHLAVMPAEPAASQRDLARLAARCIRFSPWTRACAPDGIWLDATGVAHLFGGEATMLDRIVTRLAQIGFRARASIADTPSAAWAASHFGDTVSILCEGGAESAIQDLPIAALRLPAAIVGGLRRLGFRQIGSLYRVPRATLARRFGPAIGERLDQALGRVFEPLDPIEPRSVKQSARAFAEPISQPENLRRATEELTAQLCQELEAAQEGARRLVLAFLRVDGRVETIAAGTAQPSRDARHLARLFAEKLDRVDPGFGVEKVTLTAWRSEALTPHQSSLSPSGEEDSASLAPLIDRLANRLGENRVYGVEPIESDLPERAFRKVSPLAVVAKAWPSVWPRPVRLLLPPERIETTALLPDNPPMLFVWRHERHRVKCADKPERIFGEWWRRPQEVRETRDYFRVEDEAGSRFWLYRNEVEAGTYRWYLQGFFG